MATVDDYLSILKPTEQDRKDALNQALLEAAAGILSNNNGQNFGSILGKGMYAGMQGYRGALGMQRQGRMDQFTSRKEAYELARADREQKQQDILLQAQAEATQKMGQAPPFDPGTRPALAFTPERNLDLQASQPASSPMQDFRARRAAMLQEAISNAASKGVDASSLVKELMTLQPKYSSGVNVDQKGRQYIIDETSGMPKYLGTSARDEIVADSLGGKTSYRTKFDINPLGSAQHTIDPGTLFTQGQENARQAKTLAQGAYDVKESQDGNLYYVPKVPGSGSAMPVSGPGGAPLTGPKGLSETQGNATAFGMRAKAANEIINKLEASGVDLGAPAQLLAGNRVSNIFASPTAQQAQQAKLNFMSANLRKESGAAISPSEYDAEDRKYFPQVGDSAQVREQKRQMRALAIDALKVQAGNQGSQSIDKPRAAADPLSVSDPTGKVHRFPTQQQADAFRQAAGL